MKTTGLDYVIILLYLGVMLGAGFIGSRMAKNSDDYLVAGRRCPYWVYFPCLVSVVIGGSATFGATKVGYLNGISGAWMVVMYGLGIGTMGLMMSSKMSNLKVLSLSEMLEVRYSKSTRYFSAVISVIYTSMISVLQVIALGLVLNTLLGWPIETATLIGGAIALTYTMAGGMSSLIITDTIQFVLMTVGVFFVLLPNAISDAGGFAGITEKLPANYFDPFAVGGEAIFAWFLLFYLGLMIGQDIWQRVFTAKSDKVAKAGTISAGIYAMFWAVAMALIGITALVLLPGIDGQDALPKVIAKVVPTGLQGLVFAGVISALMSTVSGCMLASSTLILNDLILPFKKSETDNKQKLFLSRIITLVVGSVVLVFALWIKDVLVALDIAYALLSGSVFVPVVAGFFWKRANWQGAVSSIVASAIVTSISLTVLGSSSTRPIIYGIITSVIVLVSVSLLTKPIPEEEIKAWDERMEGHNADDTAA